MILWMNIYIYACPGDEPRCESYICSDKRTKPDVRNEKKKEEKKRNETYVYYNTAYILMRIYTLDLRSQARNKMINLNNNSLDHSPPQLLDRDYSAIIVAGDEHTYNETKVKF